MALLFCFIQAARTRTAAYANHETALTKLRATLYLGYQIFN